MEKNKNVASLRFEGFTDSWKKIRLSEITERVLRKNEDLASQLPLTISAQYGLVDQRDFFDKRIASKDVSGYFLIKNGEFAYNKSTSSEAPFGVVKRLDNYSMGVLSILYIVFEIKFNSVNSGFLVSFFDTNKWHTEIKSIAAEGARNHGLLNISPENFFEIKFSIPNNIDEQAKIGNLLKKINNLIFTNKQKYEKLLDVKKSMLSKMFPKKGQTKPELRFEGFTDDWEHSKADMLFRSISDKGYPELDVLSATQDRGMVKRDDNYLDIFHNKKNENGYKKVIPGQFVIHLRSFQGGFAHSSIEGITSPAYTIFEFKEKGKHNDCFWKYIFSSKKFIKRLGTVTYGIRDGRSISFDEFLMMSFYFPNFKEQKAISDYFHFIDNLIFIQKNKYEKLLDVKKSLLGKMFP